ncbi:hypothetical protein [Cohnella lupini]|uniref:Uncharacterized protein n=1 Tax=Cohnella lupini TaxID=1294267 RepID=A0A3D9HRB5_9BACL|nr:hypothetical protein [Cohnella lupini]RED51945.1 hypothetical protein DFP95_13525 [Cohnella lupini]
MRRITAKLTLIVAIAVGIAIAFPNESDAAKRRQQEIPMLQSLSQLSPNQLLVTYDRPVDKVKGVTATNYWIQSTTEAVPTGIATLGMNDQVSPSNALTAAKVTIAAADNQNQSFILTFNQNITQGKPYKMIICYVTVPGGPPYSGDNGSAAFVGR